MKTYVKPAVEEIKLTSAENIASGKPVGGSGSQGSIDF